MHRVPLLAGPPAPGTESPAGNARDLPKGGEDVIMPSTRGVAQSGSALEWGSSGRRFKSSRPDLSSTEGVPNQWCAWLPPARRCFDIPPPRGIQGSHDLRRTYARRLYEAGVDLVALRQNLGHSHSKTTLRCIGVLDADTRRPPAVCTFDLGRLACVPERLPIVRHLQND